MEPCSSHRTFRRWDRPVLALSGDGHKRFRPLAVLTGAQLLIEGLEGMIGALLTVIRGPGLKEVDNCFLFFFFPESRLATVCVYHPLCFAG